VRGVRRGDGRTGRRFAGRAERGDQLSAHVRVRVVGRRDQRLLDRAGQGPALQVLRGAGLVVGAGGSAAAEGLLADDGAGRLVVDVGAAGRVAQLLGVES